MLSRALYYNNDKEVVNVRYNIIKHYNDYYAIFERDLSYNMALLRKGSSSVSGLEIVSDSELYQLKKDYKVID